MVHIFTSKSQKTGLIGEELACKFLMKHGFKIIERNYTKKWGEIDVIAYKSSRYHLIEVKSTSVTTHSDKKNKKFDVSCVTAEESSSYVTKKQMVTRAVIDPIKNMTRNKIRRIKRAIQTYVSSRNINDNSWQFDFISVFIDRMNKKAKVEHIEDLII